MFISKMEIRSILLLTLWFSCFVQLGSATPWKRPEHRPKHDASRRPTARTRNGTYAGLHVSSFDQDIFLGLPFAQPPVGDLRLRLPASLNQTWHGTRDAIEYGYACVGYGEDTYIGAKNNVSEDCLTLNIVRPVGCEHEALPVGVWIYGGGWYEGSSRDPRYNLSYIVQQSVEIGKPFIGVSINYRLHGWGFLYSQDVLDAGVANLGLRDQRLALHWIQENIHAFGGNAKNVTIWGESAGAASVGFQLLAYNGRNDHLFSGAIAESGPTSGIGLTNPTIEVAEDAYRNITSAVGCSTALDRLDCLRKVPFQTLNEALNTTVGTEDFYQVYFAPLVDGDIVARGGNDQLLDGDFVKVPYILGDNSDDGTDFVPLGINTDEDFLDFWRGYHIDEVTLARLAQLYPQGAKSNIPASTKGEFNETIGVQFKRAATLAGDVTFKAPRRLAAKQWLKYSHSPLYSYRFNAIPNGIPDYFAVTHFQEVAFVFHNINGTGFPDEDPPYFGPDPFLNRPKSYKDLSKTMSRMWASFIHDGNPNHGQDNVPHWPAYSAKKPQNFVFDANVTSHVENDDYREAGINFLINEYLTGEGPWQDHDQSR